MAVEIKTLDEFKEKVLKSDKIVAVDFTATWCGPCKNIGPHFEAMAKEFEGKMAFFKVDVDENEETAADQSVSAMPTFKIYKGGEKVGEVVGASEVDLRKAIEKALE